MADIKKVGDQMVKVFVDLPLKRRIVAVGTIMATLGIIVGMVMWANKVEYKPLYSGLSPEDSGGVVGKLRDMKIPYKIAGDGTTIMVPAESVYELRMQLASEGLAQSGGLGYEIFDQQNIGVTEFVQKVNYRRALQGELARSISQFAEVKHARVHLNIPEKSLFKEDQEKPSASVVLTLQGGRRLQENQIYGITNLVASSIENMDPENVVIVDAHGKLLAGGQQRFQHADLTATQQQLQAELEQGLQRKIESLLSSVVGSDKVTAKVNARLDFTQVEQTEENYDPETAAVRSEQRSSEKSSGKRPVATGIPGVASNNPDMNETAGAVTPVKSTNYNKSDETINYEISRVTKKIVNQIGAVNRLTIAVMVDGDYRIEKNENGEEVRAYVKRSEEEMGQYEALVKQAVGYDEGRGDSVEVVNVQFHEVTTEESSWVQQQLELIDLQDVIFTGFVVLAFAIFAIFGIRPIMEFLTKTIQVPEPAALGPGDRYTPGQLRDLAARGELPEGEELPDFDQIGTRTASLVSFAQKNPRLFAQYLKNWLQ